MSVIRPVLLLALLIFITLCGIVIDVLVFDTIPRQSWAVETLRKNVDANRNAWRACKRFRIC